MRPDPPLHDYAERLRRADVDSALRPLMRDAADELDQLRAGLQRIIDDAESDDGATAWDGADIARETLGQSGAKE